MMIRRYMIAASLFLLCLTFGLAIELSREYDKGAAVILTLPAVFFLLNTAFWLRVHIEWVEREEELGG